MEYIIFATVLNSHKMESKEYFEKVMQDHNQNRKERSLVSIAKMKQWIMTGSSSTRRTILYRRNTRNHRKMLSYKLSQLLDKVIERCFRHIAMGRRNWLQTGSHFSAQNLAFMFGLLESCKLNKVNFGEYIEDILTRILCGEEVDASFLPCDYVRHFEDGTDAEVTKTSQAVA